MVLHVVCPRISNWGLENTHWRGQLFKIMEILCWPNPLELKTFVEGNRVFSKLRLIQGFKVRGALKNSGNPLSDRHKDFPFEQRWAEKIRFKDSIPKSKGSSKTKEIEMIVVWQALVGIRHQELTKDKSRVSFKNFRRFPFHLSQKFRFTSENVRES